jgi:ArsR family metal-binding transcriptional regulator
VATLFGNGHIYSVPLAVTLGLPFYVNTEVSLPLIRALLDIWTLLPQTNCKRCGEATCSAFAAALLQQTRALAKCLPLAADPTFTERRATLEAMF